MGKVQSTVATAILHVRKKKGKKRKKKGRIFFVNSCHVLVLKIVTNTIADHISFLAAKTG